ncbi:hypothetical protein A7U60_g5993 [Sanghuangporus baumii]|uniref:Myb-like domain-containing protein n=1 Tax=Sanghuangporus baumii TaxID=108892 RepID=A0A9Q5N2H6_SANBA|nr:hypothetical protein A7U60_g5993 [Sanghuangporus baumii]
MEPENSQDTNKAPPHPPTPSFVYNTPNVHAYTQPAHLQSPFPANFWPPQAPSPSSHTPEPIIHENISNYSQIGYHPMIHTPQPMFPVHPIPIQLPPVQQNQVAQDEGQKTKPKGNQEKQGTKKSGKGARSGRNARSSGLSDTEIEALDERTKKEAEIVIPPKPAAKWSGESTMKLVDFITSPERWEKVTTSIKKICIEASQSLFNNEFTPKQCVNKWQALFRLYKATRRFLNHTGGGDGDEQIIEGNETVIDFNTFDGDDEELTDKTTRDEEGKQTQKEETNKGGGKKAEGVRFSSKTMRAFSESLLYAKILSVAEGRADIDRAIEFSSHRKPGDVDEDVKKADSKKRKKTDSPAADVSSVLVEALRSVRDRQAESARLETDRLASQKRRDEIDEKRLRLESETVELRKKRELEDLRFSKLERYRQMRDSTDPLENALARKLAEEIREEQNL